MEINDINFNLNFETLVSMSWSIINKSINARILIGLINSINNNLVLLNIINNSPTHKIKFMHTFI